MSRKKNLAGMRFGKLTVVEETTERKHGYIVWSCECDCGSRVRVPSRFLMKGWTVSCGCDGTQKMQARDLTGQRFGRLVVESRVPDRVEKGRVLWNCLCDCGNRIQAPGSQLQSGYRKSCGCLSRPPRKEWIGKQFGELTVTAYDGKRDGKHYWRCRCSCGNETVVCQSSLKGGHTTSCGCRCVPHAAKHFVEGTCVESIRSRRIARNNSSGVRGVYQSRRSGKWCAQITFQGRTRFLGSYESLEEAARARRKGEELFEEFLSNYYAVQEPLMSAADSRG